MSRKVFKYYVADFETTVDGSNTQDKTEVWASAITELYDSNEYVRVDNNIYDFIHYCFNLSANSVIYFHNLKFDGTFILDYIIKSKKYELAYDVDNKDYYSDKDMPDMSYKCMISDMGQWYSITVKHHNKLIYFKDSLKLLPFALKKIGKDFKTKHQKLDIEYVGVRKAYGIITQEEQEYIKNDVLVIKEALEIMFSEGHNKLTIGSCCMAEFRESIKYDYDYSTMFPDLTIQECDMLNFSNADEYIRQSYKGAWCYLKKGCENKIYTDGETYDVNSLYPSMMHSISGNRYPVGLPIFWRGNYIPDKALLDNKYYFIRIKTSFKLKKNHLPFLQIKGTYLYKGNEMLETSDYVKDDKTYNNRVTLTLTMTDFALLKEHYELYDFEILDGCYFNAIVGIFDNYINKYMQIKINSSGAIKQIAKLFLNNLYGKMATSPINMFKVPYNDAGVIKYKIIKGYDKNAGYIAIGSAITSYARNFTIRSAQQNYDNFIYADTDSIHIKGHNVKGIEIHPKNFCCWKNETSWDKAIFVRQKTYIEHVIKEDGVDVESAYYNVKCAGMNDRCKKLMLLSFGEKEEVTRLTDEEKEFISVERSLKDFKVGLVVPGKLLPHVIDGGTVLYSTTFKLRE